MLVHQRVVHGEISTRDWHGNMYTGKLNERNYVFFSVNNHVHVGLQCFQPNRLLVDAGWWFVFFCFYFEVFEMSNYSH